MSSLEGSGGRMLLLNEWMAILLTYRPSLDPTHTYRHTTLGVSAAMSRAEIM